MKPKFNVNVILCESADEEVTSIKNIFDTVKLNDKGTASFGIVTFINAILDVDTEFCFIYAFMKINKEGNNQGRIIGKVTFESESEQENSTRYTRENDSVLLNLKNSYFPGKGQYELLVFKCEPQDEAFKAKSKDINFSMLNQEKIVSTCKFKVI